MTRSLDDFFDMESPDQSNDQPEGEMSELESDAQHIVPYDAGTQLDRRELMIPEEMRGQHSREMDEFHDEMIKHGRDIAELAFELDPARSPRMFEVAAIYYKAAADAKISKRDAQLKLMKLMQDQKKLDLAEMKMRHEMGTAISDKSDVIMVEDRNVLLKRLREENNDK